MGKRLHVTVEGLRQAYAQHHKPDWPATYDAAMAHPLYSRLVRTLALRAADAERRRRQPQWPQPLAAAASHPPAAAPARMRAQRSLFDAKSAAANDLPERSDG